MTLSRWRLIPSTTRFQTPMSCCGPWTVRVSTFTRLSCASMFFADMFSLPQPPSPGSETGPDAIPTIPVTEGSEPLERLLRMCYPVDRPEVSDSVQTVAPILGAALKYQMPVVTRLMTKSLSSHCSMSPLAVFAVAYQLDLEEIGAKAIHEFTHWYTLPVWADTNLPNIPTPGFKAHLCRAHSLDHYSSDVDAIPAAVYYRLLDHHTTTTSESLPSGAEAVVKHIFSRPHHLEILQEAETPMGRLAHPFHDTAHANTIIRSSDNAVFHVDRYLLSFASPVLAKLFSAPATTAASDSESLQVSSATTMTHHFPENGRTLSTLFQLSYPMPDPEPI
ncbi:uncharacterized protein B0H18DRAFT_922523, partial [Fomitopsis serialis]|uniref:uncharacterized protein n=1 Tax=Fomitopsis serialis TaxID=139415 RepID=UPI002007E2E2